VEVFSQSDVGSNFKTTANKVKMKNLITLLTVFIFILISHDCKAQVYDEPPEVAMPSNENKQLIDKIIEVTHYESYFNKYCIKYISKVAKQENWNKERLEKAKKMVSLSSFKFNIYNWSSNYSNAQLKEYLELYKKDKSSKKKNFFIENPNIAKALESKTKQFITESGK
jgi:hypothetical protein